MSADTLFERQQSRLASAFRIAEINGLKVACIGRLVALSIIAVWQAFISHPPVYFYVEAVITLFALSGFLQFSVSRLRHRWRPLLFLLVLVDAALLTIALVLPNPLLDHSLHPALYYHFPQFGYFYLLPVFSLLSFSPPLVLWAGIASCLGWGAGLLRAVATPGSLTMSDFTGTRPTMNEAIAFMANPQYIDIESRIEDMLILLIVSGLLTFAVSRMRRLVRSQALAERARANLARYFSPNMVDELAAADRPFAEVRSQTVAVLFADIVGFTRQCEILPPEQAIALLRGFHRRMEQTIYDFGGTLDKYLGDGVMATFGTPQPGARNAADALACARAMIDKVADWNGKRATNGLSAIRIGIGVHSGPVVLGDVGSDRHIEFAVIGDAVNVASRLEALTRDLGVDIVISESLAESAVAQGGDVMLAGFSAPAPQTLRGRADPVPVRSFRLEAQGLDQM